jgi:hypothetical protein
LLPLFCFEAARGADCNSGDATSAVLAGVATGEDAALRWSTWSCPSEPATDGSLGATLPGVGVIGLPPLIISTISSASRLRSPSGRNGLSHPLSVLQAKGNQRQYTSLSISIMHIAITFRANFLKYGNRTLCYGFHLPTQKF